MATTLTKQEAQDNLRQAVAKVAADDAFQHLLAIRAKNGRYTFNNWMLIYVQNPDATYVMGYGAKDGSTGWRSLGRQVRKGEKSLKILAPMKRTGEDENGDKFTYVYGFRPVSVFDVSQTDGDEIYDPQWRVDGVEGFEGLAARLTEVAESFGCTVKVGQVPGGAAGYYDRRTDTIGLDENNSAAMNARTIAHELGHRFDPFLIDNPDEYAAHRGDCEVVADSVAYTVAAMHGLDVEMQSADYVAGWAEGAADKIGTLGSRIDAAVDAILAAMNPAAEQVAA